MVLDGLKASAAPYLLYLKIGLLAVLLLGGYVKGCTDGKASAADTIAKKNTALAKAAGQLRDAKISLAAAGRVLNEVNAETKRREAKAKEQAKQDEKALAIAERNEDRMRKRNKALEKAIEDARRNPDCDALLNADLAKVCGL